MKTRVINVITSIGILALMLGSLPVTVQASPGADFSIAPSTQTVRAGQTFTVDIRVDASTQEVDVVEVYVDFNATYLKVVDEGGNIVAGTAEDIIIPGEITTTHLIDKVRNRVDNDNGYAEVVYGIGLEGGTPASGVFVLGTIRFKAITGTPSTALTFHTTLPRATTAILEAEDVTGTRVDANVTVSPIDTTGTTPPAVTIASPEAALTTNNPSQIVTGTIDDSAITTATLIVNDKPQTITVKDGSFSQAVTLVEGLNTISISAVNTAGDTLTSEITVDMTSAPPKDSSGSGSPNGERAPTPPPPSPAKPTNWVVMWGVIGGTVVVALLILFAVRRKSY